MTQTLTGKNRRKHARMQMGVSLEVLAKGQSMDRCLGSIEDLSQGGMTFTSDAVLEEGTMLYLRLPTALEIRGEVRSILSVEGETKRRYGVRFHSVASGARRPRAKDITDVSYRN
ncbi:MAG: PilZ domain-containing protein [Proteobacteria bacterium]|nr:PilZ domain-containing protein [Pseudomonadota bacterium]